jgi:hypothetical protein
VLEARSLGIAICEPHPSRKRLCGVVLRALDRDGTLLVSQEWSYGLLPRVAKRVSCSTGGNLIEEHII